MSEKDLFTQTILTLRYRSAMRFHNQANYLRWLGDRIALRHRKIRKVSIFFQIASHCDAKLDAGDHRSCK